MSRRKFQQELYLVADNLLGYLSKKKLVITRDENHQVRHRPLGYDRYAISLLLEALPQYDLKQIKYAADMLLENQHANISNATDWLEIKVGCTEKGEAAFDKGYYIDLYDNLTVERREKWQKKYWLPIAIFSFLMGSIAAPLALKYIEEKKLPVSSRSTPATQQTTDSSAKHE